MKIAARRWPLLGGGVAAIAACVWPPDLIARALAPFASALERAWAYSASIVLEAIPFILVGSVSAVMMRRLLAHGFAAPAFALVLAPGCDCAVNGYAQALARMPAPVAGFAVVWAAACNPVALFATHAILGDRLLVARLVGTLVAASLTSLAWHLCSGPHTARSHEEHECSGPHTARSHEEHECSGPRNARSHTFERTSVCGGPANVWDHFASAMRSFAPAAAGAGLALALGGALLHAQPSPVISGIIAAIVSPCSTADAVLARVVAVTPAAQAAFLIAAQCADLRQAALLLRTFGLARCATSLAAGVAGCVAAVMSLNH